MLDDEKLSDKKTMSEFKEVWNNHWAQRPYLIIFWIFQRNDYAFYAMSYLFALLFMIIKLRIQVYPYIKKREGPFYQRFKRISKVVGSFLGVNVNRDHVMCVCEILYAVLFAVSIIILIFD